MARPQFRATEKQREEVKSMAACGMRQDEIATLLNIAPNTLRKHFRSELDRGALEANAAVMKSLYQLATSGKNASAAIFWAKTRCGMGEKPKSEESASQDIPALIVKVD
jgi:IS30 family transposase